MPQSSKDIAHPWPRRMRRAAASKYLFAEHGVSLAPSTLAKLAVIGGGPAYRLDGRYPVYDRPVLDAYAITRLGPLRSNTSESQAA